MGYNMRMTISAVIIVKNEEQHIRECLEVLRWCDEIVVIDAGSYDKTASIARELGTVVYTRDMHDDFSGQRNFGLQKATGDWVLFVDADERVSEELRREVMQIVSGDRSDKERTGSVTGYCVKRIDVMWGKELLHGETGNVNLIRLARRNAGKWVGTVHERWMVHGATRQLQHPLYHYPHQTVSAFLTEINYYTDLRAKELHTAHMSVSWIDILLYPTGKFFVNYVFKLGFLDGIPGIVVAVIMSFHSFLVRGKLWQLNQNI